LAELVILNLAGTVLIDVVDQLLNVDGHFELLLNDADKFLGVNKTVTIGLTSQSNEGIKGIFLIG